MKLVLGIIVSLTTTCFSQSGDYQKRMEPIDKFIAQKMKKSGIVGLGAAIIVNDKLVWTKGYGYADKENGTPFTPKTIINIGSVSKNIVGASLMRAVEDNLVSLDEDINHYLPFKVVNPFYPQEKITLRNLATHTSGIYDRDSIYNSTYYFGGDSPENLGEFLKNYFDLNGKYYSQDNFLKVKPGSNKQYSNIGAGLTGYIIEVTSGEKFNEYSQRHIFKPLKMDDTGWFLSEIQLANHSKLYYQDGDSSGTIQLYGLATYPDGGLRTSVTDLSKFLTCILNNGELDGVRILKKESVEKMLQPQFAPLNKPENVDITKNNSGIFWSSSQSGTRIGHQGRDPGVNSILHYDSTKHCGVILFLNTGLEDQKGMNAFGAIYDELWKYAYELRVEKPTSR